MGTIDSQGDVAWNDVNTGAAFGLDGEGMTKELKIQPERRQQGQQVNVKVNVNKVNDKVNDIYSIHSHYKGGAAFGRAPPKEVPRSSAAAPLLWFPL